LILSLPREGILKKLLIKLHSSFSCAIILNENLNDNEYHSCLE